MLFEGYDRYNDPKKQNKNGHNLSGKNKNKKGVFAVCLHNVHAVQV